MNIKNQLMTWASTHNFNWLVGFNNYVRGLFRDRLRELDTCEIKDIEYIVHRSALYDYDRIHNIDTLLMMYSYLEEWLYHCYIIAGKHMPIILTLLIEKVVWDVSKILPDNWVSIYHQDFGKN